MVALWAIATELLDVETRPALVQSLSLTCLSKAGIAKNHSEQIAMIFSEISTVQGFMEKKVAAMEMAAPYLAKAKTTNGRQEIAAELAKLEVVKDSREYVSAKVVEPLSARLDATKEYAAPYVASVKQSAEPYVARIAEMRKSERVEKMVAAFKQASAAPPSVPVSRPRLPRRALNSTAVPFSQPPRPRFAHCRRASVRRTRWTSCAPRPST
jgi:hypothetical protein